MRILKRYFQNCTKAPRKSKLDAPTENEIIQYIKLKDDWKLNKNSMSIAIQLLATTDMFKLTDIECHFGNLKKGKKLINSALITPNENTLAQIQYLSNRNNFVFTPQQFEFPCRFEADALNYLYTYQYKEVIAETRTWFDFQPFSSRSSLS